MQLPEKKRQNANPDKEEKEVTKTVHLSVVSDPCTWDLPDVYPKNGKKDLTVQKKRIIDPDDSIICRKCLIQFPRTLEYFHKNGRDTYGMSRVCKSCDNTRRSLKEKEKAYHNCPRRCKTCNSFFYTSIAVINKSNKRSKHHKNGGSYCSHKCLRLTRDGNSNWGMKGKSWEGKRRGSGNPRAILNEDIVRDIRIALLNGDSNVHLANVYGVSRNSISSIKNYHSWKHVSITELKGISHEIARINDN